MRSTFGGFPDTRSRLLAVDSTVGSNETANLLFTCSCLVSFYVRGCDSGVQMTRNDSFLPDSDSIPPEPLCSFLSCPRAFTSLRRFEPHLLTCAT